MKKSIELSIITVSFNTKTLLEKCLQSIERSLVHAPFTYEIIVVDNASTDGSQEVVRNNFKSARLLQNSSNVGFSKANNQGAEAAKGDTFLFLNSDVEVLDKAIAKLYLFFKTLPKSSMVGGKLFNPDMTPQPSTGPAYTLLHIFTALFLRGDYIGITRSSPKAIKKVDWIMGACMMMTKTTFLQVGGFDGKIFMYMEEIDFQHRAQSTGSQIWFYPDAHFIHKGAGSSQGRAAPILNVFRGFIYFYKKHKSNWQNIILRVILILKSVVAIAFFSILNNKNSRKLYFEALKISIS